MEMPHSFANSSMNEAFPCCNPDPMRKEFEESGLADIGNVEKNLAMLKRI